MPFINKWGANYSATYKNTNLNFELNIAGKLNGPMFIQTVYNDGSVKDSYSPVYNTLNLNGTKNISSFKITLGVNNIFDYYQTPLTNGMTEYSWGPIIGREIFGRISLEFGGWKPKEEETGEAKDLVCGMEVDKKDSFKAEYKGKTYYFCSEFCKDALLREPEKYIK